jgi:hypothetical protein
MWIRRFQWISGTKTGSYVRDNKLKEGMEPMSGVEPLTY